MAKVTKSAAPNAAELKTKLDALQGMLYLYRYSFLRRPLGRNVLFLTFTF
jgi:hypothetical protein